LKAASAALQAGRNAEAAEEFKQILAIDKTLPAAYLGLGIALGRLEPLFGVDRGIRGRDSHRARHPALRYNLGVVYDKQHDETRAIEAFQEAIRADPGYAPAYFNLGVIHQDHARYDEAVAAYRDAVRAKH
jgi:tetratricopeptide (TPR) repeat protein